MSMCVFLHVYVLCLCEFSCLYNVCLCIRMDGRKRRRKSTVLEGPIVQAVVPVVPVVDLGGMFTMDEDSATVRLDGKSNGSCRPSTFQSLMSKMDSYKLASTKSSSSALDADGKSALEGPDRRGADSKGVLNIGFRVAATHAAPISAYPSPIGICTRVSVDGTECVIPMHFRYAKQQAASAFNETYKSFVAELVRDMTGWGIIEIPSLGKSGYLLFFDGKIHMTNVYPWSIFSDLKHLGVEIDSVEYATESADLNDDLPIEQNGPTEVQTDFHIIVSTRKNCVGVFEYLYTKFSHGQKNPTLSSNTPFANSVCVKPKICKRNLQFIACENFLIPIQAIQVPKNSNINVTTDIRSFTLFNKIHFPIQDSVVSCTL